MEMRLVAVSALLSLALATPPTASPTVVPTHVPTEAPSSGAGADVIMSSFCGLCLLLVLGKVLRVKVRVLQQLYLPSSVIGGMVGLIFLQIAKYSSKSFDNYLKKHWLPGWSALPGFLINIVFASLFLGGDIPSPKVVWVKSGPQLMYGMILCWSQWVVALLTTTIILIPAFKVPPLFASIVDIGFAGGHGTAAGMAPTLARYGWDDGGSFALASATFGLVGSILFGVMWVNIATRRGWVKTDRQPAQHAQLDPHQAVRDAGLIPKNTDKSAGRQTTAGSSIDTVAFHLCVIGIAMLFGFAVKQLFIWIETLHADLKEVAFFGGFPTFPLCMLGGIFLQLGFTKWNTETPLVDVEIMNRISGTALDFLVTAAVATVDVEAIGGFVWPFIIICFIATAWQFIMIGLIARYLFPNHWFERAIPELGMNMGVIASGLVLLKMVDPDAKTPVTSDFSYKQLLHSPFMGGGVWTAASVPLIARIGIWPVTGICVGVTVVWVLLFFFYFRPSYTGTCDCRQCKGDMGEGLLANYADSALD